MTRPPLAAVLCRGDSRFLLFDGVSSERITWQSACAARGHLGSGVAPRLGIVGTRDGLRVVLRHLCHRILIFDIALFNIFCNATEIQQTMQFWRAGETHHAKRLTDHCRDCFSLHTYKSPRLCSEYSPLCLLRIVKSNQDQDRPSAVIANCHAAGQMSGLPADGGSCGGGELARAVCLGGGRVGGAAADPALGVASCVRWPPQLGRCRP